MAPEGRRDLDKPISLCLCRGGWGGGDKNDFLSVRGNGKLKYQRKVREFRGG